MWQSVERLVFLSIVAVFVQRTACLSEDVTMLDNIHGPLLSDDVTHSQKTAWEEPSSGETPSPQSRPQSSENVVLEHDLRKRSVTQGQCRRLMQDRCALGKCVVIDGRDTCVCTPPFETDNLYSCWLKRFSYILKLNVTGSRGSALVHDLCPEASQVMKSVKEISRESEKIEILSCWNGEYIIRLLYESPPSDTELEGINVGCEPVESKPNQCNLPGPLRVNGTGLDIQEENLCDYFLKQYIKELNRDHVCAKNDWGYFLKCSENSTTGLRMWNAPYRPGRQLTVHQCPELTTSPETTTASSTSKTETRTTSKPSTTTSRPSTTTSERSTTASARMADTTTSPDPTTVDPSTETGSQIDLVVVAGAGGILLLLVVIVAIVLLCRNKKRQPMHEDRSVELDLRPRRNYEGPALNISVPVKSHYKDLE